MDEQVEKRSTKRFARHAAVDLRVHTRSDLHIKGRLTDCSEGGVGFFSPKAMKRGDAILLRVCAASPLETSRWSSEAGQFNMLTAKVRWCRKSRSSDDDEGFRVGSQRMLPFY